MPLVRIVNILPTEWMYCCFIFGARRPSVETQVFRMFSTISTQARLNEVYMIVEFQSRYVFNICSP